MPLFESQKSRNARLFSATLSFLLRRLYDLVNDEDSRKILTSWLIGGSAAATAAVEVCEPLKKAWGKGDEEKALALIELFTLCMLSQQLRGTEEMGMVPKDKHRQAFESKALDILCLFGHESESALEGFWKMDIQFSYLVEAEDDVGRFINFGVLLLAKACEACGCPLIDWSKVSFPVKSLHDDLFKTGAVIGDIEPFINPLAIQLAFAAGVKAMGDYVRRFEKDI